MESKKVINLRRNLDAKIVLSFFLIGSLVGCQTEESKLQTPSQYRNTTTVTSNNYNSDLKVISKRIKSMALKSEPPFIGDKVGIKEPSLIVDTIIYSADRQKMISLVLNKYNGRALVKISGKKHIVKKIYVDGYAFIVKKTRTESIELRDVPITLGGYNSFRSCQRDLREMFFLGDYSNTNMGFRYHIDDTRIWSEPIWNGF